MLNERKKKKKRQVFENKTQDICFNNGCNLHMQIK